MIASWARDSSGQGPIQTRGVSLNPYDDAARRKTLVIEQFVFAQIADWLKSKPQWGT